MSLTSNLPIEVESFSPFALSGSASCDVVNDARGDTSSLFCIEPHYLKACLQYTFLGLIAEMVILLVWKKVLESVSSQVSM